MESPDYDRDDLAARLAQAWADLAKPSRLRPEPGPDQLAFDVDAGEGYARSQQSCGNGGCNRVLGHAGPHRRYDGRTFELLREWEQ